MNRAEIAVARHHTYLLIGRLYLDGLTADLLPHVAEIPALAEGVSRPFNPDEAAAAHYRIFAYNIFPYESIFRDPSGLLGGTKAEEVKAFYQKADVHFLADDDHIGHELSFLAALCHAEASALNLHEHEMAAQLEKIQHAFLSEHLLFWLSPFVNALSFSDHPFFTALGQLTLSLVYDHWLALDHTGSTFPRDNSAVNNLPQLTTLLQNDQTNLKQIAGFLITPPASGLYLGREAIADLAREDQLPRGFGSRQQMLSNLFHSAAQYELIPDLLCKLAGYCDSWSKLYDIQLHSFPELIPYIKPWIELVDSTSKALTAMQQDALSTAFSP